ncbi:universal stress protein [Desulfuribacillus alkaliarsenatis]|uniref:Universal stress protein n=1 Tax=Desulfuribacillus alkaliarsenatis TaxID=766136 RepID=A0A1E5G2F6_9FIRM|nr:universal stress protein [Desulfuribacillus alkaliarsenatis]OEF96721.1 hypothetical protein BHF68_06510 [Desulfuribacillus alkaliarsenatis]
MAYKSILVAVDSSNESKKAFSRAVTLATENNATLTITHVVDIPIYSDYKPYDAEILNLAKQSAEELIVEFKNSALNTGVSKVETLLETGSAKREIIQTIIPKANPDLIVVGATGTNALERVLVGSVSEYIIRHAPCDVLVVR